jgi:hypothetical protein
MRKVGDQLVLGWSSGLDAVAGAVRYRGEIAGAADAVFGSTSSTASSA